MLKKFLDLPLRIKFILSFLLVIGAGGLISLFLGTRLEHRTIMSLAEAKVRHDLASAPEPTDGLPPRCLHIFPLAWIPCLNLKKSLIFEK